MVDVCAATTLIEGESEIFETHANQGTLTCAETSYIFVPLTDTSALTQAVYQFLCEINTLGEHKEWDFTAVLITKTEVEIFQEISSLQESLCKLEIAENNPAQNQAHKAEITPKQQKGQPTSTRPSSTKPLEQSESGQKFSSLFSLARSMSPHKGRAEAERTHSEAPPRKETMGESLQLFREFAQKTEEKRFKEKEQDPRSSQDQKREQEEREKKKKSQKIQIEQIHTSLSVSSSSSTEASDSGEKKTEEMGNIFLRFMALMARILGQAEAEAHSLYLKIKARTDDIETLTKLQSKINSSSGKIDWTKDEEMKKLVDRAREIGVDIPAGKYTWTEEEKKLLKENIQMRKDNMEKITQLERTDMQRYLQEATHCHQARSNILKLLKEVIDTFVHNIRPN